MKGKCKNHPNLEMTLHSDQIQEKDSSLFNPDTAEATEEFVSIPEVKIMKKKESVILTAFDSIRPCDSSLLIESNLPKSSEFIEIPKEPKVELTPKDYSSEVLLLSFGFMVYLSFRYFIDCGREWKAMFSEIKAVINS
jgi:hypothetical protein